MALLTISVVVVKIVALNLMGHEFAVMCQNDEKHEN